MIKWNWNDLSDVRVRWIEIQLETTSDMKETNPNIGILFRKMLSIDRCSTKDMKNFTQFFIKGKTEFALDLIGLFEALGGIPPICLVNSQNYCRERRKTLGVLESA